MKIISTGSPVLVNGEEFENIEIQSLSEMSSSGGGTTGGAVLLTKKPAIDHNRNPTKTSPAAGQTCDIVITNMDPETKLESPSAGEDVMKQLVKNKAILENNRDKRLSIDSEVSEASTLVSTSSETIGDEAKRKKRINHHSIRGAMSDSEMEMSGVTLSLTIFNQDIMDMGFFLCFS